MKTYIFCLVEISFGARDMYRGGRRLFHFTHFHIRKWYSAGQQRSGPEQLFVKLKNQLIVK